MGNLSQKRNYLQLTGILIHPKLGEGRIYTKGIKFRGIKRKEKISEI